MEIDRPLDALITKTNLWANALIQQPCYKTIEGTSTLIMIDQKGRVRLNHFGRFSDMQVDNFIGGLLTEDLSAWTSTDANGATESLDGTSCDDNGCLL